MLPVLLALHVLAALFWVGGMAFAHVALRPAAAALDPSVRLPLWRRVLGRFLPLAGVSIVVLLVSGFGMLIPYFGGLEGGPRYIDVMASIGIVMTLLFLYLVLVPWPRFRTAVESGALPDAAGHLNRIRRIVEINLVLGIVTVVVAATGRYW